MSATMIMQFYVIFVKHGSKCNYLNYIDYKYLQGSNESWYCLSCTTMLFPFGNLNYQKFLGFINNNSNE